MINIQKTKLIFIIILFFGLFGVTKSSLAATYYIDFNNGSDAAAGTSTATAWKTIPGTRNTANTDWQSTSWGGVINSSNKVPAGTVFKLKSGTTQDSSNGGMILFSSTYYNANYSLSNPVIVQRDTTWGTGTVTFNGNGIILGGSGFGILHFQVGGFRIDGVVTDGILVENSPYDGISQYGAGANHIVGMDVQYVKFFNNGTSYSGDDGNAAGQLQILDATGGTIRYCNFDGNGRSINGIKTGETGVHYVDGLVIDHIVSHDHYGTDDCGMGIKTHSTSATISNSELYNNWKGSDNGDKTPGFSPILKFINNSVHDNVESGINANGGVEAGNHVTDTITVYMINNIFYNNGLRGTNFYGGNLTAYFVHNIYDNNGTSGTYEDCNIMFHNNLGTDEGVVNAYLYNNIFYKPAHNYNLFQAIWWVNKQVGTNYISPINIYSDYNSWVQRSSEDFSMWGGFNGDEETISFPYGANGPGHTSGNWYNFYGGSATVPTYALGHYHADAHSKGIGASDATLPLFTNRTTHDYTLTTNYAGTDLSSKPWYISEMGVDRNGRARSSWDIGAYEYTSGADTTPPAAPSGLSVL